MSKSQVSLRGVVAFALLAVAGLSQAQQSWWDNQKNTSSNSAGAMSAPVDVRTQAQPSSQSQGMLSASASVVDKVVIPEGTDVRLRMLEKLSSATATEGQRFNLELDEDIRINGVVVVPHGSKAVGTVVSAKKKGFMGRGGDLNVLIDYLLYKDQRIRLRASSGKAGNDKVGTAVTLTVLFGPLGLLKRGHDAEINPGAVLNAYVDQSTEIAL